MFINQGEAVSTSRFFGQNAQGVGFVIESESAVTATHWQLKA
ncbi:hypothetical protein QTO17_35175 [Vibrio owensii]